MDRSEPRITATQRRPATARAASRRGLGWSSARDTDRAGGCRIGAAIVPDPLATMARIKVGIVLPMNDADSPGARSWTRIRELARFAEAGGIDSLWVYDHLIFRMPDEPEDGIHEAWTLLTAVAAVTERVELGTIVLGTGFRPPALLAKM